MKLGTHNSMSYLPPKKWWMYPFRFIAKCQNKSIEEQYKLGARMFDIRISFDGLIPEFRHGYMSFKGNVEEVFNYLNSLNTNIFIRLLLEIDKPNNAQENLFISKCVKWETEYCNLKFFCGRRKYDWKQVYKFRADDKDIIQKVSSMTGTKLDDWCPWLYARFFNRKNFKERNYFKWTIFDFIEYALE